MNLKEELNINMEQFCLTVFLKILNAKSNKIMEFTEFKSICAALFTNIDTGKLIKEVLIEEEFIECKVVTIRENSITMVGITADGEIFISLV